MAKRKRCLKCPQPRHKQTGSSSKFDKRSRLDKANRDRRKTESARIPLVGRLATAAASMADLLDSRTAFRLSILMAGMLLADDRRVAASWFAAAGVGDDWDRLYDCLMSVGRKTGSLALPLRSLLNVREQDVPPLQQKYDGEFRTRHELLVDLVEWFVGIVRGMELQCAIWLAVDGAYAARPVLRPLIEQGVVIFSRLRKDAVLYELPRQPKPDQHGRPRMHGVDPRMPIVDAQLPEICWKNDFWRLCLTALKRKNSSG